MSILVESHPFRPALCDVRSRAPQPPSPTPQSISQHLCRLVAFTTAAAFAIPIGELTAATRRTPYVAFARQSAMYLAHVALRLSYSEVARGFNRDRTTATHACKLVEDRRDDPAVDAMLGSLESACGVLARAARVRS